MPSLEVTVRQLLTLPREAGTPEAAAARELVAAHLRSLGYDVVAQKFSFYPASLRAFPLFGDGMGVLALILFPLLASPNVPRWAAVLTWLGGIAILTITAMGIALGWVPLGERSREDANLIATKGTARPRRWVVAHLDSKSQGHSMAGRLVAVWITGLAIVTVSIGSALRLAGPLTGFGSAIVCGTALVAGVLARRGRLKGRSLGARDNGSGIVALLAAAEASQGGLGFLVTGAEEFGLVGARVFARLEPDIRGCEFVNIDTVDEQGTLYLVSHNPQGQRLAGALEPGLRDVGPPLRQRRLPLGIFVDSAPLARGGAAAVTVGRLTWATLRCIHTAADTPDRLSFSTANAVGQAIALN